MNGDDGAIRGIERETGKVVAKLGPSGGPGGTGMGHEEGSKVRCLWAGMVPSNDDGEEEEWLISGGFDQKLIVWKASTET